MTDIIPIDAAVVPPAEDLELAAARNGAEHMLRGALAELDRLVAEHAADVDGQARTYALVAKLSADLRSLTEAIVNNLCDHMGAKRIVVDGVGIFERRTMVSNTAWQQDEIWATIRRLAADPAERVDPETGEVEPEADAVMRIARELQTPGAWRKTALKRRGIDPEDVSSVNWGRRTVQFTPATGEGK